MDTNKRTKNPKENRLKNDRDKKSANHEMILGGKNSFHFKKLIVSFMDLKADHLCNQFPRFRVKSWVEFNNIAVMKLFIVGLPFEIGNLIGHSVTEKMSVVLLQGLLPNVYFLDSYKSSNGILKESVGAMEEAQIHQHSAENSVILNLRRSAVNHITFFIHMIKTFPCKSQCVRSDNPTEGTTIDTNDFSSSKVFISKQSHPTIRNDRLFRGVKI